MEPRTEPNRRCMIKGYNVREMELIARVASGDMSSEDAALRMNRTVEAVGARVKVYRRDQAEKAKVAARKAKQLAKKRSLAEAFG